MKLAMFVPHLNPLQQVGEEANDRCESFTLNSMNKPSISVVIPLFNKEREVTRAIRSVLAQSFADFELIIVNDGSTDRSVDQVSCFKDARIRLVNQNNQGVSAARNRGISEAKSSLVAFLDADDEWGRNFLHEIIALQQDFPVCDVFAICYHKVDNSGKHFLPVIRGIPSGYRGILTHYFAIAAKSDPPINASSVAVSRDAMLAIRSFPCGILEGEDLLTWARLASHYRIAYLNLPCSKYYLPNEYSQRIGLGADPKDCVGKGLVELLEHVGLDERRDLEAYIACWYGIRVLYFLPHGQCANARKELYQAFKYSKKQLKLYIYLVITFLPSTLAVTTYRSLDSIKKMLRNYKHKLREFTQNA